MASNAARESLFGADPLPVVSMPLEEAMALDATGLNAASLLAVEAKARHEMFMRRVKIGAGVTLGAGLLWLALRSSKK